MKKLLNLSILLLLCSSCIENTVDSQHPEENGNPRTLRSLMTKSGTIPQEDSLTTISKLQSDVDNLMMARILQKDGIYILALKLEDALFLGISEDVYEHYLNYVARLNEQLNEK